MYGYHDCLSFASAGTIYSKGESRLKALKGVSKTGRIVTMEPASFTLKGVSKENPTMTVIELPDDQAAALKTKAATQGLSLEDWFKNLATTNVPPMTSLNWSQCTAVESIPGKRSGAWVFRDSRTPVSAVFENLEVGATISEVMDWFHLSHEQVTAVLEFAARSLDAPLVMPSSALPSDAHSVR